MKFIRCALSKFKWNDKIDMNVNERALALTEIFFLSVSQHTQWVKGIVQLTIWDSFVLSRFIPLFVFVYMRGVYGVGRSPFLKAVLCFYFEIHVHILCVTTWDTVIIMYAPILLMLARRRVVVTLMCTDILRALYEKPIKIKRILFFLRFLN